MGVGKFALADKLQHEGIIVVMAGYCINDDPEIAKANLGVAIIAATNIVMNSAQVTLLKGDLHLIAEAHAIF